MSPGPAALCAGFRGPGELRNNDTRSEATWDETWNNVALPWQVLRRHRVQCVEVSLFVGAALTSQTWRGHRAMTSHTSLSLSLSLSLSSLSLSLSLSRALCPFHRPLCCLQEQSDILTHGLNSLIVNIFNRAIWCFVYLKHCARKMCHYFVEKTVIYIHAEWSEVTVCPLSAS